MKKILLIAILSLAISFCFSQNFSKLPDSNAIWQVNWGNSGCFEYGWFADYQYLITGDTLINSMNYNKVERSGSFDCSPPLHPVSGYMGAFRNSISTKQVFIVPRDSIIEIMLYDFNLNIGDTVLGYLQMVSGNIAIIDNIDTILVGNDYRLRWHHYSTSYFWDGYIIEGIGCDYGLLEGLLPHLSENGSLNCYSENGQAMYPIFDSIPCELITSIDDPKINTINHINCFPNPATNSFIVTLESHNDPISFEIYDISGKKIKKGIINNNGAINISMFQNGMYFIKFYDSASQLIDLVKIIKK